MASSYRTEMSSAVRCELGLLYPSYPVATRLALRFQVGVCQSSNRATSEPCCCALLCSRVAAKQKPGTRATTAAPGNESELALPHRTRSSESMQHVTGMLASFFSTISFILYASDWPDTHRFSD